jgi:DNA-binding transcriptional LysR family regulator
MSSLQTRIGTLRQLEILLSVHKTGSITAASKALFITQPTVSMQLKKLADAIGTPLYDQHGRKLIFTSAGVEVVKSAREILGCLDRLDMKLADLQGLKTGRLSLAVVNTAKYFIPHLLAEFLKLYPNIDINFKVGNRQQIIERINTGEDDFYVFSHPPKQWDLDLHEFLPNPLMAIVQEGHPLSEKTHITLDEFVAQPFLIREQGSGTRFALEQHFQKYNINVNVRMTIESNEAIKHAVMSGLGVTVLSSHTLAFGGNAGVMALPVQGLPIQTTWYLANLKQKQLSVVAQTFLDYVESQGRSSILAKMKL